MRCRTEVRAGDETARTASPALKLVGWSALVPLSAAFAAVGLSVFKPAGLTRRGRRRRQRVRATRR